MSAAWYRARAELRRGWRGTLLLALLVGLAGAAVLTTVAGARRSSTAYDRFRQETLASDLDVSFDGPPSDDMDASPRAVQTIPEVVALGRLDFPFVVPADSGLYPYLDLLAAVSADDDGNPDIGLPRFASGSTAGAGGRGGHRRQLRG